MQSKFIQYLSSKNLAFQNNVEEQITFQSEGLNYLFVYDSSDPNYFRMLLPKIFEIAEDSAENKYSSIINEFNSTYKVVKAFISSDNQIWLSVEQFVYSEENIELLFERCVMLLKVTIKLFQQKVYEPVHE